MIYQKISLPVKYQSLGISNGGFQPTLTTFVLENHESVDIRRKRPFILICPGGGYEHHSVREAEPIALAMNNSGYHAGILHYSLAPMDFPASFLDGVEALKLIREKADLWNIDSDKIVVMGFSAGGHLAASLGCWWDSPLLENFSQYKPEEIKPNALCLCYPVILGNEFSHNSSIKNVIGGILEKPELLKKVISSWDFEKFLSLKKEKLEASCALEKKIMQSFVSLENHISKSFPPTFIWHTFEDSTVPVENSLILGKILAEEKVPSELHIFTKGEHGLALATEETSLPNGKYFQMECAIWVNLFNQWLKGIK